MNLQRFAIELRGVGVVPESVLFRDIAELLLDIDVALGSVAEVDGLVDRRGPSLRLVGVEIGSDRRVVAVDARLVPSFVRMAQAVASGSLASLPQRARQRLEGAARREAARGREIRLVPSPEHGVPEALLVSPANAAVQVEEVTTLYGRCVRVGGETRPTAQIRVLNGELLTVSVTQSVVLELGRRLLQEVGLEGVATWAFPENRLVAFEANSVLPFEDGPLLDAFADLAASADGAWDGVDADAYVAELRGGDE